MSNVHSGRKLGGNGRKMGGKWDEIPIFLRPLFPFLRRPKIFPSVPFAKFGIQISAGGGGGGQQGIRRHPPNRVLPRLARDTLLHEGALHRK